jgi:DNA-binding beta-propeller fold protein YncE
MRNLSLELIFMAFLGIPSLAGAGQFDNSLWLGTNNLNTLPILNVDRAGNILRQVAATEATGIAIDPAANRLYFSTFAGQITGRDLANPGTPLSTINPVGITTNDMAFDGAYLWRCDVGNQSVQKIDPSSGTIILEFKPDVFVVGIAWDGQNLWLSEYNGFKGNERIMQFTTKGKPTGLEFHTHVVDGDDLVGGLAFDSTDNTLWLGSRNTLYHYTTTGSLLGRVPIATSGRFIDGLEFQKESCIWP